MSPVLRAAAARALQRTGLYGAVRALRKLGRDPRRWRHVLDVRADLRAFRRQYRFLAEAGRRVPPRARVLIVSLSDAVSEVKTESMLAKALQMYGGEPWHLTLSWCGRGHAYYRVFDGGRLVRFDRYLPTVLPAEVERAIDDLGTADTVKAFQFHDIEVGRLALASYFRSYHQGKIDLADAQARARLRPLLARGVAEVLAAERMLDEVRPDLILVHDALYVGVGPVFESALKRGIPAVQWIGCQRDDALTIKRFDFATRREHPVSLSEQTWDAVRAQPWTEQEERELMGDFEERYESGRWQSYYNKAYGTLLAPEILRGQLGLDPAKKTAVIFSHILWDSTLFWGTDLFGDYEEWLVETVRAACRNTDVNWVVKLHPQNVWKLKRDRFDPVPMEEKMLAARIGPLPPHVKLLKADADVNTYSLFQLTDYCLTVRGTIGIEMAAFGIPVLTAGTGRFSWRGFTVDSATREEYLRRLARIQDVPRLTPEQTALAKRYAHTLFLHRPYRFRTFELTYKTLQEIGHPLDHNVAIHACSAAELEAAPDLAAFARWALDTRNLDYLAAPNSAAAESSAVTSVTGGEAA